MVSEPADHAPKRRAGLPSSSTTIWSIALAWLVPAFAYYAILICGNYGDFLRTPNMSGPSLFSSVNYGLTFNSMLLHLLDGSFDVDPQTIGLEGVHHNGLTYTYFGILMALIRLPFLFARDFATTDYTRLSCLVAVSVMGSFNLVSLLTVWRSVGRPDKWPLFVFVALALLFGGAQIQFLMASIWQEVLLWAAAFAAAFGYLIVRGYYSERGFTSMVLAGLALTAGLCLLTRVSTALGLCFALGLLLLVLLVHAWRNSGDGHRFTRIMAPFLPTVLVLGVFVVAAAAVNYGRWAIRSPSPGISTATRSQLQTGWRATRSTGSSTSSESGMRSPITSFRYGRCKVLTAVCCGRNSSSERSIRSSCRRPAFFCPIRC